MSLPGSRERATSHPWPQEPPGTSRRTWPAHCPEAGARSRRDRDARRPVPQAPSRSPGRKPLRRRPVPRHSAHPRFRTLRNPGQGQAMAPSGPESSGCGPAASQVPRRTPPGPRPSRHRRRDGPLPRRIASAHPVGDRRLRTQPQQRLYGARVPASGNIRAFVPPVCHLMSSCLDCPCCRRVRSNAATVAPLGTSRKPANHRSRPDSRFGGKSGHTLALRNGSGSRKMRWHRQVSCPVRWKPELELWPARNNEVLSFLFLR